MDTTDRGWFRAVITTVTGMVGCATDGVGGWSSKKPSNANISRKPGMATTASNRSTASGHETAAATDEAIDSDPAIATSNQSADPARAMPNLPWIVT